MEVAHRFVPHQAGTTAPNFDNALDKAPGTFTLGIVLTTGMRMNAWLARDLLCPELTIEGRK